MLLSFRVLCSLCVHYKWCRKTVKTLADQDISDRVRGAERRGGRAGSPQTRLIRSPVAVDTPQANWALQSVRNHARKTQQ